MAVLLSPTAELLLLILVAVGVVSVVLVLRHRMSFRIAMRNVRRGRWRTVLLLLGLLVSATIISSSLGLGDTVSAVGVHFVFIAYGFTNEIVVNQTPQGSYTPFPITGYTQIASAIQGDSNIAGTTPEIVTSTSILDNATGVPQSGLNLIGVNASAGALLGNFVALNGSTVVGPLPGEIILDQTAANDVNASAGNRVTVFGPSPFTGVVQAVVQEDSRGGFLYGGNVFISLGTAQALLGVPGQINFIAVTNVGNLQDAAALSGAVMNTLNTTLMTLGHPFGLQAMAFIENALNAAIASGMNFTTITLVLGLFSIVAGAMLIVGIFVMLAEERKGEMGMLRAVGLRRRELIYVYYFEGLAYSAGSALAGTFLGVVVAYALIYAYATFFGLSGVGPSAVLDSFTVTTQSLIIAYVAGFLLTLVTVTVASARVSRLNIVRAIRDVPEPPPTVRTYTGLAYGGIALAIIGALILVATAGGTGDISIPVVGGGLLIAGLALMASRFVKNRYCFTAAGIALVIWGGVPQLRDHVIGSGHSGSIFVLFVDGTLMVVGAVLVYAFNSDLLVRGVGGLAGRRPTTVSVIRVGLSYPGRRGFRTALNITIFALVLFTVVFVASLAASFESNLNGFVQAQSGGYTFFAASSQPIPDLPGSVASNATLSSTFSAAVPLYAGGANVTILGSHAATFDYPVYSAPANQTPLGDFYTSNQFNFTATESGLSQQATWNRLATDPSAVIVDSTFAAPPSSGVSFGSATTVPVGTTIQVRSLTNGKVATLSLIGVMSQSIIPEMWLNPGTAATLGITSQTAFFFSIFPGVSADHAAQVAKVAFLPYGLQMFDFQTILSQSIDSTIAIISLLEVFVALGLAVGIAAMGIVALRAVVERRSEIGMLRAIGFTRGMTLRAFLLEYSFIALLGIAIGTGLSVLLLYGASFALAGFVGFTVPWLNVALVVGVAYILVILAIIGPSRRAANLPPADAIRYSE